MNLPQNTKLLAHFYGGSHLYGTNIETSDIDHRGVYLNTSVQGILMPDTAKESAVTNTTTEDSTFWELRYFLSMLSKGKVCAMEVLWCPENKFIELDNAFSKLILTRKRELVNRKALYASLGGYLRHSVNKVRVSIEKGEFDAKDAAHALRLAYTGNKFFQTGEYDVSPHVDTLRAIREDSANWENKVVPLIEAQLSQFDSLPKDKLSDEFSWGLVRESLLHLYLPYLEPFSIL